jgi:hypothetical protein
MAVKKLFLGVLFFVLLAAAVISYNGIRDYPKNDDISLRRISMNDIAMPGKEISVNLELSNVFSYKLKDVIITVMIDELDVYSRAGPFDLSNKKSERLRLELPRNTPKGIYYARIVISNGNVKKVLYREIVVR